MNYEFFVKCNQNGCKKNLVYLSWGAPQNFAKSGRTGCNCSMWSNKCFCVISASANSITNEEKIRTEREVLTIS